jgi:hypothetical protein
MHLRMRSDSSFLLGYTALSALSLFLLLGGVATLQGGCGYCGGALRRMRAATEFSSALEDPAQIPGRIAFYLIGDGPNAPGPDLLTQSRIGPESWVLIQDASGQHVPVKITGIARGHSCRNGVSFEMEPEQELPAGTYTLVVQKGQVNWPLVEGEELRTYRGERALVRHFVVKPSL